MPTFLSATSVVPVASAAVVAASDAAAAAVVAASVAAAVVAVVEELPHPAKQGHHGSQCHCCYFLCHSHVFESSHSKNNFDRLGIFP